MQRGFTKLFNTIVTSTIWQEDDKTRIVWITMLAIADAEGIVSASIPGLASVANVSVEAAEKAVNHLLSPDEYSRTKDFEGRRIESVDGGWMILNYVKYRRMLSTEERKEYKAKWIREKRRQCRQNVDSGDRRGQAATTASASSSLFSSCSEDKKRGTEEQCVQYCQRQGLTEEDGRWFFDRCESSGWKNSGRPIADWQATVRAWKRVGTIFPSQKNGSNGRVVRQMSSFEIKERIGAITQEINATFKKNGGRVEGDGIDELKKRREDLQKQLLV